MAIVGLESIRSLVQAVVVALADKNTPYSRQWRASSVVGSYAPLRVRVRLLLHALRPVLKELLQRFVLLLLLPIGIYLLSFVLHLWALPSYSSGKAHLFHDPQFNCRFLAPSQADVNINMSTFSLRDPRCGWQGCANCAKLPSLGIFGAIWRLNTR